MRVLHKSHEKWTPHESLMKFLVAQTTQKKNCALLPVHGKNRNVFWALDAHIQLPRAVTFVGVPPWCVFGMNDGNEGPLKA